MKTVSNETSQQLERGSCILCILLFLSRPITSFQPHHHYSTHELIQQTSRIHYSLSPLKSSSLVDLWESYNEALVTYPLFTKSITASIILGSADLVGQVLEKKSSYESGGETVKEDEESKGSVSISSVDWARVSRFALFGLALQAPWNHYYYLFLDGTLPPTEDPFTVTTAVKVLIDQFIQAPIFTAIIFVFLGVLEGKKIDAIKNQLDEDYWNTLYANWKLWVPATIVNIAFCPPIFRVLFLNFVFFFWSIYLSLTLNKSFNNKE